MARPARLTHLSFATVDGIFHVCRAFDDKDIVHVEDRVDPVEDLEIIHKELRQKVPVESWRLKRPDEAPGTGHLV